MEGMTESLASELEKIRQEDAEAAAKETAQKAEEKPIVPEEGAKADAKPETKPETTETTEVEPVESTESKESGNEPAKEVTKSFKELLAEEEEKEARMQRLKEIEELENDEFVKLVLNAKKQGVNPKQLIMEIADIDPDKLSEEDLFMMTLPSDMDSSDKADEYDTFQRMNESFRNTIIEQKRNELKTSQSEKLKALMGTRQNIDVKDAFNNATVGLDAALEKLQGKEYKGIELTPARLVELRKEAIKFFGAYTDVENKSIDFNEALETAFARKALSTWSDDIKKAGENEGKIKAFKEIHNPNAMRSVGSAQNKGQKDGQAELDAIFDRIANAPTTIR